MPKNELIDRKRAGVIAGPRPVVHLEMHTGDSAGASDFYARLLGWRSVPIATEHGCYVALGLGGELTGGVVECGAERPSWLPYVEVERIDQATEAACRLGASLLLRPREGPAGWRSVVSAPGAGQLALWQPKEWR